MTNKFSLKILTAIAFLLFAQASPNGGAAYAQTAPARTVLDYYQKLPAKYLLGAAADSRSRLKYIKVRDIDNGYLKIETPYRHHLQDVSKIQDKDEKILTEGENQSARLTAGIEIALFKHEQGKRHIVAVTYRYHGDCPACAMPAIDFYEDRGGVLKDVSDTILSQLDARTAFAEYTRLGKPGDEYGVYTSARLLKRDLVYELPRAGRTIKIVTDSELKGERFELMNFRWTGKAFVSEPVKRGRA